MGQVKKSPAGKTVKDTNKHQPSDRVEFSNVFKDVTSAKGVANTAIAIAWILRHPARMQPIIGTTNPGRVKDICKASDITLTRQEWYEIYRAAGNKLP